MGVKMRLKAVSCGRVVDFDGVAPSVDLFEYLEIPRIKVERRFLDMGWAWLYF